MSPKPTNNHYQTYKTQLKNKLPMFRIVAFNWAIILAGLLFQNGFNAISLILVARRVDPVVYGQYVATYSLVSFLVILPGFGMDAWLLTQSQSSKEGTTSLWLSTLRIRGGLLIIWAMFMALLSDFLPDSTFPQPIVILTVVDVAFTSLIILSYSALRIQNRHSQVTGMQSLSSALLLVFILILPVKENYIYQFAFVRMCLSIFICLVVVFLLLGKNIHQVPSSMPFRQILRSSKLFLPSELAASVYIKADVILVSVILGSTATSVYSPALSIIQASFLVSSALFFFTVPRLSRIFVTEPHLFINRSKTQLILQITSGICIPFVLWILAPEIINFIFGLDYGESIQILRYLSLIPFLRSINFGLAAILISGGYQRQRAKVQLFVAAFNIIGILLIILPLGLIGVSAIFNISEFILICSYGFLSWKLIKDIKRNQ